MSVHKILETTLDVRGEMTPEYEAILTPEALVFVEELSGASDPGAKSCSRSAAGARSSSIAAACPISCPRPGMSVTATGRSRPSRRTSWTAASRSRAPWTAR